MEIETYHGHFCKVEEDTGETYYVPEYIVGTSGLDNVVETVFGFGIHLTAPGYLDQTDWEVYDTLEECEARKVELEEEELEW